MTTEPATPFTRPLLTTEEAERLNETLEKVGRGLSQTLSDAAIALGRALEPDMARWRVRNTMPTFTVRGSAPAASRSATSTG